MRCSKRRALATVVTSGILLSAVAVMGSMLVAWSNTAFTTEQTKLNIAYSDGVNKLNEFLVIENVWFGNDTSTKFLNVTISNVGNVGLTVTKITLDDSIDKLESIISNGGIIRNDNFSTEITYDWKITSPIEITITTEKGLTYKTYAMGP